MRGLIIPPFHTYVPPNTLRVTTPAAADLRLYLHLWDVLDAPTIGLMEPASDDLDLLEQEGVLRRTQIGGRLNIPGMAEFATAIAAAQALALANHNLAEGERWALAKESELLRLPPELGIETRTLQFAIVNGLVVPDATVPIEEVLAFRERYAGERAALRTRLDEAYLTVRDSNDSQFALQHVRDSLARALNDYNGAVASQGRWSLSSGSIKVTIDARHFGGGVAMGVIAGAHLDLPLLGGALGGVMSSIDVRWEAEMAPNQIAGELSDYAYLHRIGEPLRSN